MQAVMQAHPTRPYFSMQRLLGASARRARLQQLTKVTLEFRILDLPRVVNVCRGKKLVQRPVVRIHVESHQKPL